jgi:DNA-binding MarR family transcriptional regulator
MDNQDLRTLKILEEIDNDHSPSQRDLAKRLNVSLGLVNSFVKRLTQKGYFKITTIPKNRVRYIMTPKGIAEKTRLTYEYIHYSIQFYRKARQNLREIFKDLESQHIRRIAFFGASDLAEIAYISLQETSIKLVAVIDDQKAGDKFLGVHILATEAVKSLSFDRILISVIGTNDDVIQKITAEGVSRNKIVIVK